MHRGLKLSALISALVLAVAVATALGSGLEVNDQDFRAIWSPLEFGTALGPIACPVTLTGSFHRRTMAKTAQGLIGHVTGVTVNDAGCTGGGAGTSGNGVTVLAETLPWHLVYNGFSGDLPEIGLIEVSLIGAALQIDTSFPNTLVCLMRTTAEEPMLGNIDLDPSTGQIDSLVADESAVIDHTDIGIGTSCDNLGVSSEFLGSAGVDNGAGGLLFVDLVEIPEDPVLEPTPSTVVVRREESSDSFTLRNVGTQTATLEDPVLEGVDGERPEFEVSAPGCTETLAVEASCTYTIRPIDRPLREARVIVSYRGDAEHRVSIPVELQGEDPEGARLVADPSAVTIEALEQNDIVAVTNDGGGPAATVTRVVVESTDRSTPDFEVTSPGCRSEIARGETCIYVITVNDRPEASGRITIHYRDGLGGEEALAIDVDIAEDPRPAELEADPTSVTIERLESNDSFVIRNIGAGTTAAEITRVAVSAADTERPEFAVTGPGCPLLVLDDASCTYIISVNSRPEPSGQVIFEYRDGIGATRRTTVEVDIAS